MSGPFRVSALVFEKEPLAKTLKRTSYQGSLESLESLDSRDLPLPLGYKKVSRLKRLLSGFYKTSNSYDRCSPAECKPSAAGRLVDCETCNLVSDASPNLIQANLVQHCNNQDPQS